MRRRAPFPRIVRPPVLDQQRLATVLFVAEDRSRWAARECARGAAAAALVAIASTIANAAMGVAVALVLSGGLLMRRIAWSREARVQHQDALAAEMAASVAASNWRQRARWGLRTA